MRRSFYRFPEDSDQMVRFKEGCAAILKDGREIYPESIPEERWAQIECIGDVVDGVSVTRAKELLRKYGGSAWTEHYERDGTISPTSTMKTDGFYRERKKDLSSQISGAAERAGHDTGAERNTEKER